MMMTAMRGDNADNNWTNAAAVNSAGQTEREEELARCWMGR